MHCTLRIPQYGIGPIVCAELGLTPDRVEENVEPIVGTDAAKGTKTARHTAGCTGLHPRPGGRMLIFRAVLGETEPYDRVLIRHGDYRRRAW